MSSLQVQIGIVPGSYSLEGRAGCQHLSVGELAADDLHSYRQPLWRESRGYRRGWMAGEVDGIGEAPAYERVDTLTVHLRGAQCVTVRGVVYR